jgi:hypothetical protein
MLSESLSVDIDKAIEELKIKIPSEEEVSKAERIAAAIRVASKPKITSHSESLRATGERVLIWPTPPEDNASYLYKKLSPLDDTIPINIGGNAYPSISYYVIACEFTRCCVSNRPSETKTKGYVNIAAYKMLKNPDGSNFRKIKEIEQILDRDSYKEYSERIKKNAKTALQVKFKDREYQNVLLATGNSKLVWDDRSDNILGSGKDGRGYNFVGKELMKLRVKIRNDRQQTGDVGDINDILTVQTINKVFLDPFLKEWLRMRVRDMCNVIITMKDYMYLKHKLERDITPDFVRTVLDRLYQPCSHLFAAVSKIESAAPAQFSALVWDYKGFFHSDNKATGKLVKRRIERQEILNVMWRRLAVLIYYLIKHMRGTTSINLSVTLGRIESLASMRRKCVDVLPNDEENCIFSAIVNLLRGITKLDSRYGTKPGFKEIDINAAVTILLNINRLSEQQALQRRMKQPSGQSHPLQSRPPALEGIAGESHEEEVALEVETDDEVDVDDYLDDGHEEVSPTHEPNSEVSEKIRQALNGIDTTIPDDDESVAFMLDDAIRFVKSYPMRPPRVKTNRINFFASLIN